MSPNHHPIKTALALSLALALIAPAAASAKFDLNPRANTTARSSQPATQIVRISAPSGFDWGDAGIGAAGALGLSMLALGGGLVIAESRRRRAPARLIPGTAHHPQQAAAGDLSQGSGAKSKFAVNEQETTK